MLGETPSPAIDVSSTQRSILQQEDIEKLLPHRRPFLFLESAQIIEPGVKAIGALADLSGPDFAFLESHFPRFRMVPGAIIMETLAELSGIAVGIDEDKLGILRRDKMVYRQMIRPGEAVGLEAEIVSYRKNVGISKVRAHKDGSIVAEGEIVFAIIDKPQEMLV